MRLWMVNPKFLCRKHLMGEHLESHMFVGSLNKGTSLNGFVKGGLVDVSKIQSRHDELAKEMVERGYNHKSQIQEIVVDIPKNYYISKVNVEANIEDLKTRCPDCNKRITDQTMELIDLTKTFIKIEGAQHVSC